MARGDGPAISRGGLVGSVLHDSVENRGSPGTRSLRLSMYATSSNTILISLRYTGFNACASCADSCGWSLKNLLLGHGYGF